MDARLAIKENERQVKELLSSSKELAETKNITVCEAIDLKVNAYMKLCKTENQKAALELRAKQAKKQATIESIISVAKEQNEEISKREAFEMLKIENICCENRLLRDRFIDLGKAGFDVEEAPMKTGFGVGRCVRRMKDGKLRVRVSANWAGKFGNYAYVVHI